MQTASALVTARAWDPAGNLGKQELSDDVFFGLHANVYEARSPIGSPEMAVKNAGAKPVSSERPPATPVRGGCCPPLGALG